MNRIFLPGRPELFSPVKASTEVYARQRTDEVIEQASFAAYRDTVMLDTLVSREISARERRERNA
jgi:hypothetical protein